MCDKYAMSMRLTMLNHVPTPSREDSTRLHCEFFVRWFTRSLNDGHTSFHLYDGPIVPQTAHQLKQHHFSLFMGLRQWTTSRLQSLQLVLPLQVKPMIIIITSMILRASKRKDKIQKGNGYLTRDRLPEPITNG